MSEVTPIIEMELYIVRHGQSCMNIKDGYGVPVEELTRDQRENPPLTELGKRQAELLGEYYKDVKFDDVYASPLRRATMTADYALQKNNVSDKHIYTMPWLIECGVGEDYSAVTLEELNAEFDGIILAPEGIDVSGYLVCGDGQNQASHRRRAENVILDSIAEKMAHAKTLLEIELRHFDNIGESLKKEECEGCVERAIDRAKAELAKIDYEKPRTYQSFIAFCFRLDDFLSDIRAGY